MWQLTSKFTGDIARGFPASLLLSGDTYLAETFGFYYENVWRNFGILLLFTIVFIGLGAWFTELFEWSEDSDRSIEYKPTPRNRFSSGLASRDEEENPVEIGHGVIPPSTNLSAPKKSTDLNDLVSGRSTFSWHNIKYTIPYRGGTRTLLNDVSGYCTPGTMTALVGSSGAGKTTRTSNLLMRNR